MVIDELIGRKGAEIYPIDSLDNQMIDEIIYECQSFHFAKQKDLIGTSEIVANNGVAEPIISLSIIGYTAQGGRPTPDTPITIQNVNNNGLTIKLGDINIEIPTSIDVDGTNVPLLFSAYDSLSIDRLNNKVIYSNGSWCREYTGTETGSRMALKTQSGLKFYQSFTEKFSPDYAKVFDNVGYCSHFKRGAWNPLSSNNTFAITSSSIIWRTDGAQTLDEFKAFLVEQYANGTPVTVVLKRKTSIDYDLSNTDLGKILLTLATKKGENHLTITSDLAPSQMDLSYWRQIIPNE